MYRRPQLTRLAGGFCAAAVFLVTSCSANASSFHIDAISPSQLTFGTGAQLLISGGGFEQGDKVKLNDAPLSGVVWVSESLLSVALPDSLQPGPYSVVVTDPRGRQTAKPNALQVSSPAPTHTPSPTATATPTPARPTPTPTPVPTRTPTESPTPRADTGTLNVSGTWSLTDTIVDSSGQPTINVYFPGLRLQQNGNTVTGSSADITSLRGTFSGRTLNATYSQSDGSTGNFYWTFSADGSSFSGNFTNSRPNGGTSHGTLVGASAAAPAAAPQVLIPPQQPPRPAPQRRPNHGGSR